MIKTFLNNALLILLPVLSFGQTEKEIHFLWKPAISGTQKFENAVMLVPVKFPSDTITYYLQLDTGATHSSLYSNRLNGDVYEGITSTSIGEVMFRKDQQIQATDKENITVGTLGVDFLKDKVVLINYKKQTIRIDAPYDPHSYKTKPMTLLDGRPVISIDINGKNQRLMYDTGSSLFGIWTTKGNWNKLRERNSPVSTFPISSWGKLNDGFYSSVDETKIPDSEELVDTGILKVWYVANKRFKRFFRKHNIYGILGNQPFLEDEILLDFRRKIFGVKRGCNI